MSFTKCVDCKSFSVCLPVVDSVFVQQITTDGHVFTHQIISRRRALDVNTELKDSGTELGHTTTTVSLGHTSSRQSRILNVCLPPTAEEAGRDASRAAAASQVLQDLSDHVGQQRRHHQQAVRRHGGTQGSTITFTHTHSSTQHLLKQTVMKWGVSIRYSQRFTSCLTRASSDRQTRVSIDWSGGLKRAKGQTASCLTDTFDPLQGDFTRTGERKLAGVMKDGVNSANRYYLNRFRDAYRQAVIGGDRRSSCAFPYTM